MSARVIAEEGIDPAAAAVLGETAQLPAGDSHDDAEPEESIYETMKRNMRDKQVALDAQNSRRPGAPAGLRPAPPTAAAVAVQRSALAVKAADLTDLNSVWAAARQYLATNARTLEMVLGGCTRVHALTTTPPEVTLRIPNTQERFTNDKARAKLEEALRAVTDLPLKLRVEFIEVAAGVIGSVAHGAAAMASAPLAAAQRVAPEVMEAIKNQAIVQELMKRFDATVTQVDMLGTGDADPA